MADKRIDQLTAATSLGDSDLLVVEQESAAKKATGTVVSNYINSKFGLSGMANDISTLQAAVAGKQDALTLPLPIAQGGTGANNSEDARKNINAASSDDIEDLRRVIEYPLTETSWSEVFEQGSIAAATGRPATNQRRIRTTNFISPGILTLVQLPNDMEAIIFEYGQADYESYIGALGSWRTGDVYLSGDKYYKLSVKYTNDSNILPDAGANIAFKRWELDSTLEASGKIPDSKAVGDAIAYLEKAISEEIVDVLQFSQGAIKTATGGNIPSSTRIRTGYYEVPFGYSLTVPQGLKALPFYYNDAVYTSFVGAADGWRTGEVNVLIPPAKFVKFVFAFENDEEITPTSIDTVTITRHVQVSPSEVIRKNISNSWGVANILANSAQIAEPKWTPVGNLPKTVKNNSETLETVQYFAITEQTGIPYSSSRDQDKAVGLDVSIHTFMTAVRDPNSVLYKRLSTVTNSAPYYGAVCSALIDYATGIGLDLPSAYLAESDMFQTIPMTGIMPGDMIWTEGHCALVYDVSKDSFGRISSVTIREEWRPLPKTTKYSSWESFISERGGYIARRFIANDGVTYSKIPYVQCFDEEPEPIVYPEVQTDHGDAAVFKVGESVKVNVINPTGFTSITVKRGETTIYTSSTISGFTLENVQAGLHTITASGTGAESVSTFFVVDCSGTFNESTGEVTFSSSNATPVMVGVYSVPANRKVIVRNIILSEEEKAAGEINVLNYMDSEYRNAKVWFLTPYGTAVWYSENHAKWIDIP